MADQVNRWLQKELGVIPAPLHSFEVAFASGKLLGKVCAALGLLDEEVAGSLEEGASSGARVRNFKKVAGAITASGVALDGRLIKDVMTEARGAAVNLLLRVKDAAEGASEKRSAMLAAAAQRALAGATVRDAAASGTRAKLSEIEAQRTPVEAALAAGVPRKQVLLVARLQKYEQQRVQAERAADEAAALASAAGASSASIMRDAQRAARQVKREWLTQHLAEGEKAWAENQRKFLARQQADLAAELGAAAAAETKAHNAMVRATREARSGIAQMEDTIRRLGAGPGGGPGAAQDEDDGGLNPPPPLDTTQVNPSRARSARAAAGQGGHATPMEVSLRTASAVANPLSWGAMGGRGLPTAGLLPPPSSTHASLAHSQAAASSPEHPTAYFARMEAKAGAHEDKEAASELMATIKDRAAGVAKARRERATRERLTGARAAAMAVEAAQKVAVDREVAQYVAQGTALRAEATQAWVARTLKARRVASAAAEAVEADARRAVDTAHALQLAAGAAADAKAARTQRLAAVYAAAATTRQAEAAAAHAEAVATVQHTLQLLVDLAVEASPPPGPSSRGAGGVPPPLPPATWRRLKAEFVSGAIAERGRREKAAAATQAALHANSAAALPTTSLPTSLAAGGATTPALPSVLWGRVVGADAVQVLARGGLQGAHSKPLPQLAPLGQPPPCPLIEAPQDHARLALQNSTVDSPALSQSPLSRLLQGLALRTEEDAAEGPCGWNRGGTVPAAVEAWARDGEPQWELNRHVGTRGDVDMGGGLTLALAPPPLPLLRPPPSTPPTAIALLGSHQRAILPACKAVAAALALPCLAPGTVVQLAVAASRIAALAHACARRLAEARAAAAHSAIAEWCAAAGGGKGAPTAAALQGQPIDALPGELRATVAAEQGAAVTQLAPDVSSTLDRTQAILTAVPAALRPALHHLALSALPVALAAVGCIPPLATPGPPGSAPGLSYLGPSQEPAFPVSVEGAEFDLLRQVPSASTSGVRWNEWAADDALIGLGIAAQALACRAEPVTPSTPPTPQPASTGWRTAVTPAQAFGMAAACLRQRRAAVRWAHLPRDSSLYTAAVAPTPGTPKPKGRKSQRTGPAGGLGSSTLPGSQQAWPQAQAPHGVPLATPLPAVELVRSSAWFVSALGVIVRRVTCRQAPGIVLADMPGSWAERTMVQAACGRGATVAVRLRPAAGEGSDVDDGALGAMLGPGAAVPACSVAGVTVDEQGWLQVPEAGEGGAPSHPSTPAAASTPKSRKGPAATGVPSDPRSAEELGAAALVEQWVPVHGEGEAGSVDALPLWLRVGPEVPVDAEGVPDLPAEATSLCQASSDELGPPAAETWAMLGSGRVVRMAAGEGGAAEGMVHPHLAALQALEEVTSTAATAASPESPLSTHVIAAALAGGGGTALGAANGVVQGGGHVDPGLVLGLPSVPSAPAASTGAGAGSTPQGLQQRLGVTVPLPAWPWQVHAPALGLGEGAAPLVDPSPFSPSKASSPRRSKSAKSPKSAKSGQALHSEDLDDPRQAVARLAASLSSASAEEGEVERAPLPFSELRLAERLLATQDTLAAREAELRGGGALQPGPWAGAGPAGSVGSSKKGKGGATAFTAAAEVQEPPARRTVDVVAPALHQLEEWVDASQDWLDTWYALCQRHTKWLDGAGGGAPPLSPAQRVQGTLMAAIVQPFVAAAREDLAVPALSLVALQPHPSATLSTEQGEVACDPVTGLQPSESDGAVQVSEHALAAAAAARLLGGAHPALALPGTPDEPAPPTPKRAPPPSPKRKGGKGSNAAGLPPADEAVGALGAACPVAMVPPADGAAWRDTLIAAAAEAMSLGHLQSAGAKAATSLMLHAADVQAATQAQLPPQRAWTAGVKPPPPVLEEGKDAIAELSESEDEGPGGADVQVRVPLPSPLGGLAARHCAPATRQLQASTPVHEALLHLVATSGWAGSQPASGQSLEGLWLQALTGSPTALGTLCDLPRLLQLWLGSVRQAQVIAERLAVWRRVESGLQAEHLRARARTFLSLLRAPWQCLEDHPYSKHYRGSAGACSTPSSAGLSATAALKLRQAHSRLTPAQLAATAGPRAAPPPKPWLQPGKTTLPMHGTGRGPCRGEVAVDGGSNGPTHPGGGRLLPHVLGQRDPPLSLLGTTWGTGGTALAPATLYRPRLSMPPAPVAEASADAAAAASGSDPIPPMAGSPRYPTLTSPGQAALYEAGRHLNALPAEAWGQARVLDAAGAVVDAAVAQVWSEVQDAKEAAAALAAAFQADAWLDVAEARQCALGDLALQAALQVVVDAAVVAVIGTTSLDGSTPCGAEAADTAVQGLQALADGTGADLLPKATPPHALPGHLCDAAGKAARRLADVAVDALAHEKTQVQVAVWQAVQGAQQSLRAAVQEWWGALCTLRQAHAAVQEDCHQWLAVWTTERCDALDAVRDRLREYLATGHDFAEEREQAARAAATQAAAATARLPAGQSGPPTASTGQRTLLLRDVAEVARSQVHPGLSAASLTLPSHDSIVCPYGVSASRPGLVWPTEVTPGADAAVQSALQAAASVNNCPGPSWGTRAGTASAFSAAQAMLELPSVPDSALASPVSPRPVTVGGTGARAAFNLRRPQGASERGVEGTAPTPVYAGPLCQASAALEAGGKGWLSALQSLWLNEASGGGGHAHSRGAADVDSGAGALATAPLGTHAPLPLSQSARVQASRLRQHASQRATIAGSAGGRRRGDEAHSATGISLGGADESEADGPGAWVTLTRGPGAAGMRVRVHGQPWVNLPQALAMPPPGLAAWIAAALDTTPALHVALQEGVAALQPQCLPEALWAQAAEAGGREGGGGRLTLQGLLGSITRQGATAQAGLGAASALLLGCVAPVAAWLRDALGACDDVPPTWHRLAAETPVELATAVEGAMQAMAEARAVAPWGELGVPTRMFAALAATCLRHAVAHIAAAAARFHTSKREGTPALVPAKTVPGPAALSKAVLRALLWALAQGSFKAPPTTEQVLVMARSAALARSAPQEGDSPVPAPALTATHFNQALMWWEVAPRQARAHVAGVAGMPPPPSPATQHQLAHDPPAVVHADMAAAAWVGQLHRGLQRTAGAAGSPQAAALGAAFTAQLHSTRCAWSAALRGAVWALYSYPGERRRSVRVAEDEHAASTGGASGAGGLVLDTHALLCDAADLVGGLPTAATPLAPAAGAALFTPQPRAAPLLPTLGPVLGTLLVHPRGCGAVEEGEAAPLRAWLAAVRGPGEDWAAATSSVGAAARRVLGADAVPWQALVQAGAACLAACAQHTATGEPGGGLAPRRAPLAAGPPRESLADTYTALADGQAGSGEEGGEEWAALSPPGDVFVVLQGTGLVV